MLSWFEYMSKYDYEELILCQDQTTGLKAVICIHDTSLGPALGGCRMWTYASEEEAILDALRLARGMTYKAAAAGLDLGGGKAVIIADPKRDKSEALFRAFGRFVQGLNGRYITAVDLGTTVEDMDMIYEETNYVVGRSSSSGSTGNPSTITALGIYRGMKAAAKAAFGDDELKGRTIAIQGVGNVATYLIPYLHEEGAKLIVTDVDKKAVRWAEEKYNAVAVDPDDIYSVECDIFSPCAIGGVVNDETIPQFKAKVIAGSANNVLKEDYHGTQLFEAGIYYAPDYVINAGGLINVADELAGYNQKRVIKKVEALYDKIEEIFEISQREQIPTHQAANQLAEERIATIKKVRSNFISNEKRLMIKEK